VVETKFSVDTTRTCLCWLQPAPCTYGIFLTQQGFKPKLFLGQDSEQGLEPRRRAKFHPTKSKGSFTHHHQWWKHHYRAQPDENRGGGLWL